MPKRARPILRIGCAGSLKITNLRFILYGFADISDFSAQKLSLSRGFWLKSVTARILRRYSGLQPPRSVIFSFALWRLTPAPFISHIT